MSASTPLSMFMKYAAAPPHQRRGAAMAAMREYRHFADYYLRLRQAIGKDRRTTRDGAAVAAAVQNARPERQHRFSIAAARWGSVAAQWRHTTPTPVERTVVNIATLSVGVSPWFAERHPDGTVEIVLGRCSEEPLDDRLIDLSMRVAQRAYEQEYPGVIVTYVDLWHSSVHSTADRDLNVLDFWIDGEAAGLAYALRTAAA